MLPKRWGKRLKLHESVQRSLCRLTFLTLGAIPVIATVLFWLASLTPWWQRAARQAWEDRLGLVLGVSVEIQRAVLTGPWQYRLEGIELRHAETEEPLGKFSECKILWKSDECLVSSDVVQVDLRHVRFLMERLHERLLCQPNLSVPRMHCRIGRFEVVQDGFEIESYALEAVAACDVKQSLARAIFRSLDDTMQQRSVEVSRIHTVNEPMTRGVFVTGDKPVSSSMLTALAPLASHLGPNSSFQGKLEWWQSEAQSHIWKISGVLNQVSWSNMTASMDYHCTGTGRIYLQEAMVVQGQLVSASGSLSSDSGKMHRDWLELAQTKMGVWVAPRALQTSLAMVPFASIQLAFQWDGEGLIFQGRVPALQPNYGPSVIADELDGIAYVQQPVSKIPSAQIRDWLMARPVAAASSAVQLAGHMADGRPDHRIEMARWLEQVLPYPPSNPHYGAQQASGSNAAIQR